MEQASEFVYVRSLFARDGKIDEDVERRVNAGNKVNDAIHSIVTNQLMHAQGRTDLVHRPTSPNCTPTHNLI